MPFEQPLAIAGELCDLDVRGQRALTESLLGLTLDRLGTADVYVSGGTVVGQALGGGVGLGEKQRDVPPQQSFEVRERLHGQGQVA
nr:hypothetical protein [Streptomyces kasugaensis]